MLLVALTQVACSQQLPQHSEQNLHNNLMYAVAWKQTAAEYRALYHQGFNLARMRLELALVNRTPGSRPLAVISDVDETLLLSSSYWGYLVNQRQDFFDDSSWDKWIAENRTIASPGASKFLQFCKENNVEVFYVTSRNQGEETYQFALANLASAGFPYVDSQHVTVLRDSSNKEIVQQQISEEYDVVVLLGDNLNDFSRRYYVTEVDQRLELSEEDSDKYGRDYILFPNPTDGHWIRAIFGDSEPPANDQNRLIFKHAATSSAWSR
ncbi:MAG: acid phosphatase [SAR86 cluster bacterium]|uniref:Acid phosphatase n=1 Tax=SAR86 cluster bacterium TaxID=2030880 RepID=A0A2A5B121_9GAMM|nr:MAG: acid phosphatase [SAR86 cluster bacterium]